jgi:predicted amidohydrolase
VNRLGVACVQLEPRAGDADDLVEVVRERVLAAARTDLVVLPELWNAGYFAFDRYAERAEPLDGPTVTAMRKLAAEARVHLVLGSVLERRSGGALANTSVVIAPDGEVRDVYRKIHVFGYGSRESELVQPGDRPVVVDVGGVRLGLAICYDLRFPELFRRLVDLGAECVAIPASWPRAREAHWELLPRARAVENLCGVVTCNATGVNEGVAIAGGSQVVGPLGEVLARAGSGPEVLTADLDLDQIRSWRREFPALADRQPWLNGAGEP